MPTSVELQKYFLAYNKHYYKVQHINKVLKKNNL